MSKSMDLSARLQLILDRKGWSQADMHRASGVTRATINNYIRHARGGQNPSAEKIGRIARAAGCASLWLSDGIGEPEWTDETNEGRLMEIVRELPEGAHRKALLDFAENLLQIAKEQAPRDK